ncbi:MAG TPA: hypothetical protein DC057_14555 [Spirochaetia bacterium]|nr:hypothetical protein [Spirochaetia bacterium]
MKYIEELINGAIEPYAEDRLSQVFSATFNNSCIFKEIFIRFIDANLNSKLLSSKTQLTFSNNDSRLDICILSKKEEFIEIVIENKIEAILTTQQLAKYDSIKQIKKSIKVAFVKYYFLENQYKNWKILHWSEFAREIIDCISKHNIDSIELFIINQFLNHLEKLNMYLIPKIEKSDFLDFCNTMTEIRKNEKIHLSLKQKNIFSTAELLMKYFEEIVEISRKNESLLKIIGKNYRFNPYFNWWSPDIEKNTPDYNISLCAQITLSKIYKEIKNIGIGVQIDCTIKKNHKISIYALTKEDYYSNEYIYSPKDIIFKHLSETTVSKWKEFLNIK